MVFGESDSCRLSNFLQTYIFWKFDHISQSASKLITVIFDFKSNNNFYHDDISTFLQCFFPKKTRILIPLRILNFWTKFAQKRYFWSETKESEQHHWILHTRIRLATKFSLKTDNFHISDQICPKRMFLIENEKSEHHLWILHIRISWGIKFQPKLIILTFWTKFAQKRHFWSKTEKGNITIEFYIFELE